MCRLRTLLLLIGEVYVDWQGGPGHLRGQDPALQGGWPQVPVGGSERQTWGLRTWAPARLFAPVMRWAEHGAAGSACWSLAEGVGATCPTRPWAYPASSLSASMPLSLLHSPT